MSFDPTDPIGSVFGPVLGRPCWNVRAGYGSAFMMEFGEPRLRIREPIASSSESEKVRRSLARRRISILGDWSLLIEFCSWRVLDNGILVASSEAEPTDIEAVIRVLDGQQLSKVSAVGTAGTSRFAFDLGGTIETSRFDDELPGDWTFLTPELMALSYRADGCYSWQPGSSTPEEEVWLPLPER